MKFIGRIVLIASIIFILYLIFAPYIIIELWNTKRGQPSTISKIIDKVVDNTYIEQYNGCVKKYTKDRFGELVSKELDILDGYWSDFSIQSYPVRFDSVLDNKFTINLNKENGTCNDNFSEILSTDPKFQHLYSEWVKKQVGIEDENVELKFSEALNSNRLVGDKPYIDFQAITDTKSIEEQICNNTYNLYVKSVSVNNYIFDNEQTLLKQALELENKVRDLVFIYNSKYKKEHNQLYINFRLNNSEIHSYTVRFNYDEKTQEYKIFYKDDRKSDWIGFSRNIISLYDNEQDSQEILYFEYGYPDWTNDQHHAGFDIVANRVMEILDSYMAEDHDTDGGEICYWVTGHSMGAGVANLVASNIIDRGNKDNVYCYTFAAPNTFYATDNNTQNYKEPKGTQYRCIFNVVNDDDFVPKLPMEECEWTKYGRVAIKSLNSIIYNEKGLSLTTYNYKIRHEFDEYAMSSLITNNERYLYSLYNGNSIVVDKVIEEFSNIYVNNKNDMRKDTYTFNNDFEYYENASFDAIMRDIAGYNKYTLSYLKREKDGYRIKLVQMPAYFMNVVAGGMHNNNNNGETRTFPILNRAQIKFTQLAKRYVSARDQLVDSNSKIEMPHYLESYYNLTKTISTSDFR